MIYRDKIEKIKQFAIEDNEDDTLDIIKTIIDNCKEYTTIVESQDLQIQTQRFRLDQQEFVKWMSSLNQRRTANHEACLSSVNILNRIANIYGMDKIYDSTNKSRDVVAEEFIFVVAKEYK